MADEMCRRLRISNDETAEVVDLVANHLRFMDVMAMRPSTLKRFLRKPNFADHLELHRVDCLASHGNLDSYWFCQAKLEELANEPMAPLRLVRGDDLIALGYAPGPRFKQILEAVEDRQLENTLHTREEALDFVRREFPLVEQAQP